MSFDHPHELLGDRIDALEKTVSAMDDRLSLLEGQNTLPPGLNPYAKACLEVDPSSTTVLRLRKAPFGLGQQKAMDLVARLGTNEEDLDAWLRFEKIRGTSAMRYAFQGSRRPSEIPAEIKAPEVTGGSGEAWEEFSGGGS